MKLRTILPVLGLCLCLRAQAPIILETGGRELPEFEVRLRRAVEYFAQRFSISVSEMDTIRVIVTYSRREFDVATVGSVPDWGVGAAIPSRGEIVVLFDESSRSPRAAELIAHELGHIVLHRATGDVRLPRWFDEGFAQWVSGGMKFDQSSRLAWANLFGRHIPLRELESMNSWDTERAHLAYAESRAAFEFLLEMLPGNRPEPLVKAIERTGDFGEGLRYTTGLGLNDFYIIWARERANRFGWSLLLADWRVSFSIITFLFLLLGTVKLVRMKRARTVIDDEKD